MMTGTVLRSQLHCALIARKVRHDRSPIRLGCPINTDRSTKIDLSNSMVRSDIQAGSRAVAQCLIDSDGRRQPSFGQILLSPPSTGRSGGRLTVSRGGSSNEDSGEV